MIKSAFEQQLFDIFSNHIIRFQKHFPKPVEDKIIDLFRTELRIEICLKENNPLNLRETVCLLILANGKNPDRCADVMNTSTSIVLNAMKSIHKKLNVRNQIQAFFKTLQCGYIQIIR